MATCTVDGLLKQICELTTMTLVVQMAFSSAIPSIQIHNMPDCNMPFVQNKEIVVIFTNEYGMRILNPIGINKLYRISAPSKTLGLGFGPRTNVFADPPLLVN